MTRARGANTQLLVKPETTPGTLETDGYNSVPFEAMPFGGSREFVPDNTLDGNRDPAKPGLDPVQVTGSITAPVDVRNIGFWLKALMGTTTAATTAAATGHIALAGQPDADDTITVNGTVFTFVSGTPSSGEIEIGIDVDDTLANMASVLNGSADTDVDDATYAANTTDDQLTVTHDTAGPTGNSFTLAASGTNLSVSGSTLTGGAYKHVFKSEGQSITPLSVEKGFTDVNHYYRYTELYVTGFSFNVGATGALQMQLDVVGFAESARESTSIDSDATALAQQKFYPANATFRRDDAVLSEKVTSIDLSFSSGAEATPVLPVNGVTGIVDPGKNSFTGTINARIGPTDLLDAADGTTESKLELDFEITAHERLVITCHKALFAVPSKGVDGPAGAEMGFAFQGMRDSGESTMLTIDLYNDVASY